MCIPSRIQKYIAEKEALDAKIAKLERLEAATAPVKNLLVELLADYSQEAPEDLTTVWEEVLAIGQNHNLSVQPLAVDELRQWEADRAENEKLKLDAEKWRAAVTISELAVKNLRSQLELLRSDHEVAIDNDADKLSETQCQHLTEEWSKEAIRPELQLLYQEALSESAEATPDSIPALTLWQPWATLIAQEIKRVETRSWATDYRGPIAIHAAKKSIYTGNPELLDLLVKDCEPPLGAVVAIADLIDCVEMTPEFIAQQSDQELKCGDWTPGRFAWILEIIRPVVPAISATGGQKLWNWVGTSIKTELQYLENLKATTLEPDSKLNLEFLDASESPEPTELQKLLKDTNNYIFQKFGARVKIDSEFIEDDHGEEPEMVEEALFTVTDLNGERIVHYYHSAEDLTLSKPISGWNSLGNLMETAEDYAKKWAKDISILRVAKQESDTEFETMGFNINVYPQPPLGVTFRFLNTEGTVVFTSSLTIPEVGDRDYKSCAWDLISSYRDKEAARLEKEANPYKKPEDDFVELVKLTPAVGYLKRRDNGELIAAYAAFSNRCANGDKAVSFAKVRAKKWAAHLHGSFAGCGWQVSEPRNIKRMEAEVGAKQQFSYEIKIAGTFSIGQLQKLAEEDFSLLPNEEALVTTTATVVSPPSASTQIYRVKLNSYELASGTEEEMRSRFEEELKILGGSQMSVSFLTGSEVVESYKVNDFEFVQIEDFDAESPEYEVTHLPSQKSFRIYKKLAEAGYPPELNRWTNTLYPYTPGFTKREAAAADAVRRLLKV